MLNIMKYGGDKNDEEDNIPPPSKKLKNSSCFNGFFRMKKGELNKIVKDVYKNKKIPVSKLRKPQILCVLMKLHNLENPKDYELDESDLSCFNNYIKMKKSELNKELKKYDPSIAVSKMTKPEILCSLMKLYNSDKIDKITPEKDPMKPNKKKPKPEPELPKPKPEPELPKPEPELPKPEPELPKPEPELPEPKPEPKPKPELPKPEPKPEPEALIPEIPKADKDIPEYMKDDVKISNVFQVDYNIREEIYPLKLYFEKKKETFLKDNKLEHTYTFNELRKVLKDKYQIKVSDKQDAYETIDKLFDKYIMYSDTDRSKYEKMKKDELMLKDLEPLKEQLEEEWNKKYTILNKLWYKPSFEYKENLNNFYASFPDKKSKEIYKELYEEAVRYYPLIFVNYIPKIPYFRLSEKQLINPETPQLPKDEKEAEKEDENIAEQIKNNLKFIKELEKRGQTNILPSYDGWFYLQYILTIIFSEKYNTNCPLLPILTDFKYNPSSELTGTPLIYATRASECIKKGEKVLIIPLTMPHHENMVIIKVDTREVLRFEPHGEGTRKGGVITNNSRKVDKYLTQYTDELNKVLKLKETPFKYIHPEESCPRVSNQYKKGFQSLEGRYGKKEKSEGGGYCQLWSFFFAECVISNPDMPFNMVYKYALEALRDNPETARNIIRGYFHEINEKMREFSGVLLNYVKNIPKIDRKYNKEMKSGKTNVLIFDYINKKKEILNKKPDVFKGTGKDKDKKFIMPDVMYGKGEPKFIMPKSIYGGGVGWYGAKNFTNVDKNKYVGRWYGTKNFTNDDKNKYVRRWYGTKNLTDNMNDFLKNSVKPKGKEDIQAVIFNKKNKKNHDEEYRKDFLKSLGIKPLKKVHITGKTDKDGFYRYRIKEPNEKYDYRTKKLKNGIEIIYFHQKNKNSFKF